MKSFIQFSNKKKFLEYLSININMINSAKIGWDKINNCLDEIIDFYSLEETIKILKENDLYKNYLGKSKNRTLIVNNPKLYKSIYSHTTFLDDLNGNLKKFSSRILLLVFNEKIICDKCNSMRHWKLINKVLKFTCKCKKKYPSKEWYIEKYGSSYEEEINKRKEKLGTIGANSKNWYIKKYGDIDGIIMYNNRYIKQLHNLNKLKQIRVSKISQELFWSIFETLPDEKKSKVYFSEHNNEYLIRVPPELNYSKNVIFPDFKYNKKLIEYDGIFWHKNDNNNRIETLKKMGYDVLVITSDEYNRNKKPKAITDKCIQFINAN